MLTVKINSQICGIKTGLINTDYKESNIKSLLALNQGANFCQIVPTRTICSFNQVFFALEQAIEGIKTKTSFSRKPELEFLIRVFGRKQLDKVLEIVQLKKGKNEVLLICAQKDKKKLQSLFSKAQKILGFKEKKIEVGKNKKELKALYRITENELKSLKETKNPLESIIIEKNSLVVFES